MKFSSVLVLAAIAGTSSAASTCCNALASEGCTDPAFPVQLSGTLTTDDEGTFIFCCGSADNYINNVGNNPTCGTPSAGFASSTSIAIGAAVAFLAMIFV
jgi:hypothetical protein